ncbi:extracellular solute-binding protein [Curtobacterium flaccumfaciens]
MTRTRFAALGALALAGALALTGCSAGSNAASDGGTKSIGTPDGTGKTITVWMMNGDLSDKVLDAAGKQFTADTGAKVKIQTQQWDGITTKLTTALAQSDAPDVVDLGNTQVPIYAAAGGLTDLTPYRDELKDGQTWLTGLEGPATVDGKLYGAPLFAGNRAVVYDKKVWKDAGVTDVPTTYDELTADLDKVKAANPASDFSAFYMPGQYWYGGLQWVWDAGGEIATDKGGKWTGTLDSADAVEGLTAWKDFQNAYSAKSTQDINTDKPSQSDVFAQGNTSAFLGSAWEIGSITTAKPEARRPHRHVPDAVVHGGEDAAGVPRRLRPGDPGQGEEPGARAVLPEDPDLEGVPAGPGVRGRRLGAELHRAARRGRRRRRRAAQAVLRGGRHEPTDPGHPGLGRHRG